METGIANMEIGRANMEIGKEKIETATTKIATGKAKVETGRAKAESARAAPTFCPMRVPGNTLQPCSPRCRGCAARPALCQYFRIVRSL